MIHLPNPASAKSWCEQQRQQGQSIGYIPTMGALHPGHISLVKRSLDENDQTCVSIFVNPLQFNHAEDLEKYPRTLGQDLEMLESVGCAMVYTGALSDFFPELPGITQGITPNISEIGPVNPGAAAEGLEASHRPGHLEGVYLIVERLFLTVGHCRSYFGEKDFQQTLVVKTLAERMGKGLSSVAADESINIDVIVCPTLREPNGLAMSSRNARLSAEQREIAAKLYQSLQAAESEWGQGQRDPVQLESSMMKILDNEAIRVEYAAIRDPKNWTPHAPSHPLVNAQALVAAWIGEVRLIDNLRL